MAKKLKLEHDQSDGYNYFRNLADELVISIFTKLSCNSSNVTHDYHVDLKALGRCLCVCKQFNALASVFPALSNTCFQKLPDDLIVFLLTKLSSDNDNKYDTIDDLKVLGQCSTISKHFNSLVPLVPTLSINHPAISTLYNYCPLILHKFKHIRSLQVAHCSTTAALMGEQNKAIPAVNWEASYRPHSYSLAVVAYKNASPYFNRDSQSFMLSDDTPKDDQYHDSVWSYIHDMFSLHHMLVSSIKDHTFLQRVVVTDLDGYGNFILEQDTIAELRNSTTTNLEHVLMRDISGSAINLDVPYPNRCAGVMMNNVCFSIVEWREKPMHDPIPKDEDVTGIPTDLQSRWLLRLLALLLEDPAMVEVNDCTDILQLFSYLKSSGYLI